MPGTRSLGVLVCIAVVFAAVAPGAFGLLCPLIAPALSVVALVTILCVCAGMESCEPQPLSFLSALSSRAPPER